MQDIRIEKAAVLKEKPNADTLAFGADFTDHMFVMNYDQGQGWHDPRIVPFQDFSISPAAMVLHYAQEIFEGMKAYRGKDGTIRLFRANENCNRFHNSADRLGIPHIPESTMLKAITTLVKLEQDWVPEQDGTSLYIRPFIFANEPHLGVHSSKSYTFAVITCPVGSYYKEGINPIKIMIENEDVRAVRGGTGYAKCGGNYAASIRASERAEKKGYSQVLWLDGVERKYIEEVGSMNVMFKIDGKIITPELTGSVLPGVTRMSCVQLLKEWGYEVEERLISVDELMDAAKNGKLEEAWGTGTAAVVSPIGEVKYGNDKYTVNDFKIGEVTQKLYDTITGLQWGKVKDTYFWTFKVC